MPRPTVGSLTERLYDLLAPLAYADEANAWALLIICNALIGRGQEIEDLARDSDDGPGWSALVDPDRVPRKGLAWTAQAVGVRLPAQLQGETDSDYRARVMPLITAPIGFGRGTRAAMEAAVLEHLTGTQALFFKERHGGAYRLSVATWATETPDPAALLRAVLSMKPGGIVLGYGLLTGDGYGDLFFTHDHYQHVLDVFADYQEVLDDPTQQ